MKPVQIPLLVALAIGVVTAQTNAGPGVTEDKNTLRITGCVSTAAGQYVLLTDAGNTYRLAEGGRGIRLDQHVGEQVVVTGWESRSLSKDFAALGKPHRNPELVVVTTVKTIESSCPATTP
jgi:uncharacterized protein DUF5818